MAKTLYFIVRVVAVAALVIFLYFAATNLSFDEIKIIAKEHRILGALLLGLIMFSTTVFAPLTSLPLIPVVAPFLGPFTTGLACYLGWVTGAIVAFWIGRTLGQPFVSRYIDLSSIRKYEKYVDPNASFVYIVLLHMMIPVDIFSYILGMFTKVSIRLYAGATLVGLLWFSFSFAYAGDALVEGNYVLLMSIGVASVVILYLSWKYARTAFNSPKNK